MLGHQRFERASDQQAKIGRAGSTLCGGGKPMDEFALGPAARKGIGKQVAYAELSGWRAYKRSSQRRAG